MIDLNRLEELARAATAGPWMRLFGERTVYDRTEDGCRGNAIVRADTDWSLKDAANLDYISAANPATMLDLIAMIRKQEAELASARAESANSGTFQSIEEQEPFHHYGLSAEQLQQLLGGCLKPEEISGEHDVQHDRVHELVWWFARFMQGNANPKWVVSHACELEYFIATNGVNRHIDLKEVRNAAFKEGVNITPAERGTLERIGFATPRPVALPSQPDSERDAALPVIQKGWALNQADFSVIANGGVKPGYVMLVRTGEDRANWHKFADADTVPLYVTGKGMTLAEAMHDAIREANAAPPVPDAAMVAQQGEKGGAA